MTPRKVTTLNLRIDVAVKNSLILAARREHRSLTNMIEVLVCDDCRAHDISVPGLQAPSTRGGADGPG